MSGGFWQGLIERRTSERMDCGAVCRQYSDFEECLVKGDEHFLGYEDTSTDGRRRVEGIRIEIRRLGFNGFSQRRFIELEGGIKVKGRT